MALSSSHVAKMLDEVHDVRTIIHTVLGELISLCCLPMGVHLPVPVPFALGCTSASPHPCPCVEWHSALLFEPS